MTKAGIAWLLLLILACGVPAFGQAAGEGEGQGGDQTDEESVPRVVGVSFQIAHYTGGRSLGFEYDFDSLFELYGLFFLWTDPVPFNPNTELAKELDLIFVDVTVVDADLAAEEGEETEEEFFHQVRAWAASLGPPEPPPVWGATVGYEPPPGITVVTPPPDNARILSFTLQVPEILGVNQRRLRGEITWDVVWDVEVRIANTENPEDGEWDGFFFFLFGVENAVLRELNPHPFSSAGPDMRVPLGSTVELDGSRTFDSTNLGFNPANPDVFEKDNLTYMWEWISGPPGTLPIEPTYPDPIDRPWLAEVTLDTLGTYEFRLGVDDGYAAIPSLDTVVIEVGPVSAANRRPRAIINAPVEPVAVGEVIVLDATASSDPDGDTLRYRWRQTDEVGDELALDEFSTLFQPLGSLTSATVEWQALRPGFYYFLLIVEDDVAEGSLSDTAMVSVEVVEAQAAQTASESVDQVSEPNPGPALPALCGWGLLPAALLPLLLWPIRGRGRR